jgi:hypothetical protein
MADDFSFEFDTFELMDMIDAVDDWEHRYERELSYVKELIENVALPDDCPEEMKGPFEVWMKKLKRREQELKNKVPDRKEKATLIKTKLIVKKRKLAKASEAAMTDLPPDPDRPVRPRHPELD